MNNNVINTKQYVCKYCLRSKSMEHFYSRRTNECKECLKEKIKCEVCLHYFTRSNMNHHIQKKHMLPEVEKLCSEASFRSETSSSSEASSNSSPNVNVCGSCGETKELPVFRTICKDCINQKLREKVNCEKCGKILSKRHWYTHRRLCDPIDPARSIGPEYPTVVSDVPALWSGLRPPSLRRPEVSLRSDARPSDGVVLRHFSVQRAPFGRVRLRRPEVSSSVVSPAGAGRRAGSKTPRAPPAPPVSSRRSSTDGTDTTLDFSLK